MKCHGWTICYHKLFDTALDDLVARVLAEQRRDPMGYKAKDVTKLLARVYALISDEIPTNPSHPKYRAGTTLRKPYRDWKRAKPEAQHRLFFKYSTEQRKIIYAWLNDLKTLRRYGSRDDAYEFFMRLLAAGKIPNNYDGLNKSAEIGDDAKVKEVLQ